MTTEETELKHQPIRDAESIFAVRSTTDPTLVYQFNLSFLMGPLSCTYGRGCKGMIRDMPTVGCCAHGTAIYPDDNDEMTDEFPRMAEMVHLLTDEQWESRQHALKVVSEANPVPGFKHGEGKIIHSRSHNGACVFQNSADFDGGTGCALHIGAMQRGDDVFESKPYVCSYYPITGRVSFDEDTGTTYFTVTNELRSTWAEEADWLCTEDPESYHYTPPHEGSWTPTFVSFKREIIHLTEPAAYNALETHANMLYSTGGWNPESTVPLRPSVVSVPVEITSKS